MNEEDLSESEENFRKLLTHEKDELEELGEKESEKEIKGEELGQNTNEPEKVMEKEESYESLAKEDQSERGDSEEGSEGA
jgi:hypothetical protein